MNFNREYFYNLFNLNSFPKEEEALTLFLNLHGVDTSKYTAEYKHATLAGGTLYSNPPIFNKYNYPLSKYPYYLRLLGLSSDNIKYTEDVLIYHEWDKEILEVFKIYFDVVYENNLEGNELEEFIKDSNTYDVYLKFKE